MKSNARSFLSLMHYGFFNGSFVAALLFAILNFTLLHHWHTQEKHLTQLESTLLQTKSILDGQESFRDLFAIGLPSILDQIHQSTPMSTFKDVLGQLASQNALEKLIYSTDAHNVLPGIFDDGKTQKIILHLHCEAPRETAIFKFVHDLQYTFPGLVLIEQLRIMAPPSDHTLPPLIAAEIAAIVITQSPRGEV